MRPGFKLGELFRQALGAVEHVLGNLQGVQLAGLDFQCATSVGLADKCQVGERVRVVEGLP